jgi:RNA polymerase subunit RPABC4/transcription elongation factor Spt4
MGFFLKTNRFTYCGNNWVTIYYIDKQRTKSNKKESKMLDKYHRHLTSDKVKHCPRCSESYTGFPALSRRDNKTEICGSCGTEEGMEDFVKAIIKQGENE